MHGRIADAPLAPAVIELRMEKRDFLEDLFLAIAKDLNYQPQSQSLIHKFV